MARIRIVSSLAILSCAGLLGHAEAAQQVFVVGPTPGPGIDFTEPQDAVAAAGDGDVVLVRMGVYGSVLSDGLVIDGKGIAVVADTGSESLRPQVGSITVRNVGAGRSAVVRGFTTDPAAAFPGIFGTENPVVLVRDCAGSVVIENCRVDRGFPAASAQDSGRVQFLRCSFKGADSPVPQILNAAAPGDGARATRAGAAFYECELAGGRGADALIFGFIQQPFGLPGGAGVRSVDSTVVLAGSTANGGAGGHGSLDASSGCLPPGAGGDGVRQSGAVSRTLLLDSNLAGGAAGTPAAGCAGAASGVAHAVAGGTVNPVADSLRHYSVTSPVREGETAVTTVTGQAGDVATLLYSFAAGNLSTPQFGGMLLPGLPFALAPLGVLPAGGVLAFSTVLPADALPAGVEGALLYEQVLVGGASGAGLLSTPTAVAVLDGAF